MAYQRNGGARTAPRDNGRENGDREKNHPVLTRRIWTPSGTLELADFEKVVEGTRKLHTNFFVTLNRSYPDPKNEGRYIDTAVLNPQGSAHRSGSVQDCLGLHS